MNFKSIFWTLWLKGWGMHAKPDFLNIFIGELYFEALSLELFQICLVISQTFFFFSIRVFYHGHWRLTGQQGNGGDLLLFHSTNSTRSRTFRHLFATLHVRWLSRIFNRNACIYQTATRWDVPPYRITIWLIDDVTLSFCLFTWWFEPSFFCYSNLRRETGWFELASTITLVLQANGITKCASHPKLFSFLYYKKVCKNHDCCYVGMPNNENKIFKYNYGEKSMKSPFIIYSDLECILKKWALVVTIILKNHQKLK